MYQVYLPLANATKFWFIFNKERHNFNFIHYSSTTSHLGGKNRT